jgi:hypothetical protein
MQPDDQNLQSPLQKKAMAKLMGLQFKISYMKGSENVAADALSRVNHVMSIQACSAVQPVWLQEVINSYVTDTKARRRLLSWLFTPLMSMAMICNKASFVSRAEFGWD